MNVEFHGESHEKNKIYLADVHMNGMIDEMVSMLVKALMTPVS